MKVFVTKNDTQKGEHSFYIPLVMCLDASVDPEMLFKNHSITGLCWNTKVN
jgi:hypothetical protein